MEHETVRPNNFLDDPWRLGGVLAIAFVVLFFVGIVLTGDSPNFTDNATDIRSYFTDHADKYIVGDWLIGLAVVLLFLPFAVTLRMVLARADPSGGMWATIAFAGALVFVVLGGASSVFQGAAAVSEAKNLDDSTLHLIMAADAYGFSTASLGLALFAAASSLVIVRSGVLWRWLAVIGAVSTVALIISNLWGLQHDDMSALGGLQLIGLLAVVVFVLGTGICMLVRKGPRLSV